MKNLEDLEKFINSELTSKINNSLIKHETVYININHDELVWTIMNYHELWWMLIIHHHQWWWMTIDGEKSVPKQSGLLFDSYSTVVRILSGKCDRQSFRIEWNRSQSPKKKKSENKLCLPGVEILNGPRRSILRATRASQRPYNAKSEIFE